MVADITTNSQHKNPHVLKHLTKPGKTVTVSEPTMICDPVQ